MLEGQNKKYKYLDHLPDNTPFGMVEVDMKQLIKQNIISKQVYDDNAKQLQARQRQRNRKL